MNINIFGGKDPNSFEWIPSELHDVVKNPLTILGCHIRSKVWEIRDSFRRICLENLQGKIFCQDSLCKKADNVDFKKALLAFRLLMKDFVAPVDEITGLILSDITLKHIGEYIESSPLMNSKPEHMLMALRPLPTIDLDYLSTSRACRMLHVVHVGHGVGVPLPGSKVELLPFMQYTFQVYYCTRKWKITKRFSEFMQLQEQLTLEFTTSLPETLKKNILFKFGLGLKNPRAKGLATFVNEMHTLMAQRGVFSPRLTQFLEIDIVRIHFEEEGRISKVIDSPRQLPLGSVWHPVDEIWLTRWRRFVLGRGARCYFPPGKITNLRLLQSTEVTKKRKSGVLITVQKLESKPNLKLGHDYRALNFNMCNYLMFVHGGGPWISRMNRDITSDPGQSSLQAIVRVQGFLRMSNAINRRVNLEREKFNRMEGVRLVLYETMSELQRAQVTQRIKKARHAREKRKLVTAVNFTAGVWRNKTMRPETGEFQIQLLDRKHEQEMFAEADGSLEQAVGNNAMVVCVLQPIVALPGTERHYVTFTHRLPCNLSLYDNHSTKEVVVLSHRIYARDYKARHQHKVIPPLRVPTIEIGSIVVAIDLFPAANNDAAKLSQRLSSSTYPIRVTFQRPLVSVSKLHELDRYRSPEVKHQNFKRLLVSGLRVKYHRLTGLRKKHVAIDSTIWITPTHISWREENWQIDDDVNEFLKRNDLYNKYGESFCQKGVTREILEHCNGVKCIGAYQDFNTSFAELGIETADEDQLFFKAVTTWQMQNTRADYDSRKGCCLYDIEYVRHGNGSRAFPAESHEDHCFVIAIEKPNPKKKGKYITYTLAFEVVPPEGDTGAYGHKRIKKLRDAIMWGLKSIMDETRRTKFFVDKAGEPSRRHEPLEKLVERFMVHST